MADKNRYPQIPSTVWWGVRSLLQRTPNATIDERLLGVELGVQEAAARQYITELKIAGILTEEGKSTPIAQKWRLDDTYAEAVEALLEAIYPESLLHVAADRDRQKVVNWFLREGLGQGSAGNKAATYLLISSPTPNEAAGRGGASTGKDTGAKTPQRRTVSEHSVIPLTSGRERKLTGRRAGRSTSHPQMLQPESFPLNINVQIHISSDAGAEQIESIFSAMRRYLYDNPST